MESTRIQLRPGSIWIDGRPVILFSSSLFYFRIAAEEWRSRMRSLARLGYNTIDVYFPWNYHELEPGRWDFAGQRDAAAFLQMAQEEGLWVIARPGPYICSEWDGGALPASLSADPEMRLRDADPAYLRAVRRWYERILPIIAQYQVDRGGTVIMVQIENELDFYDCRDRPGMMRALRDMALAEGITVPLIACAGQGSLPSATGGVDGIVPTCNVYFDARDPGVEARVRHYACLLREQGYPLGIIETNRAHTDLRRLIISGAKLVGPYLQAGGTDFGFTTGVTNWGDPMAFMTSHYDFGGMISPGGMIRPEGVEARLLTRMLDALGLAAALAAPVGAPPVPVKGTVIPSALTLDGGGWLIGLANPGDVEQRVSLGEGEQRFPRKAELTVSPRSCPYLLFEFPLAGWGVVGEIRCATAELMSRENKTDALELTFLAGARAEIALRVPNARLGEHTGWRVEQSGDEWLFWKEDAGPASGSLNLPDGKCISIRAVDRETASGIAAAEIRAAPVEENPIADLCWSAAPVVPCGPQWFEGSSACSASRMYLEQNGIFRGYGWYRSDGLARAPEGLLLHGGADVLSVYAGTHFLGAFVPGGVDVFLPWQPQYPSGPENPLSIRAEIWGHANFDDGRLPALRLKSLRGVGGVTAVWDAQNLTPNWYYQDGASAPAESIDPMWPYLYFGGWSTTKEPAPGVYYRQVLFAPEGDTRMLHFPELQVNVQVYADGKLAGEGTPFNPWVDLSQYSRPGETACIAIAVDRRLRRTPGQVMLYQGQAIQDWQVRGWGEAGLARLLDCPSAESHAVDLPFGLHGGEMAWLHSRIPEALRSDGGLNLMFGGQGIKVSAWVGDRLVGRIWLPSGMRPRMAGGPDDRVSLPAAWVQQANGEIRLLLEAVEDGRLDFARLVIEH